MRILRILILSLCITLTSFLITIPAQAIPSLPSSFYGMVKINGTNLLDGTVVQALIDNQVYAEGFTQTYQGDSVFAIDVPGDDPSTTTQEGGREGDTIQFKIGGILADQTGIWHSGTNVNLDLTATSSAPTATPQATFTPVPTQTPIRLAQPSKTPTIKAQALPTDTLTVTTQDSLSATPTSIDQSLQTTTSKDSGSVLVPSADVIEALATKTSTIQPALNPVNTQSSSVLMPAMTDQEDSSSSFLLIVIIFFLAISTGILFVYFRKKKSE